jgi:rod shape determining protein RodA
MLGNNLNERDSPIDWLMLIPVVMLMLIGIAFIYSATSVDDSLSQLPWYNQFYFKQIIWCLIGVGAAVAICLVDYHSLSRWAMVVYAISLVFLILVLIEGIGKTAGGARRWISLGFFQLQPSEFAKLAFIFAQAHFLSRPVEELRQPKVFWGSIGLTVVPFVLILKEPDLGSALVFLPVGLIMLYVAGTPPRYLARLVGIATIMVGLVLFDVLVSPSNWQVIKLKDYQRQRLMVYFGIDFAPPNATPEELRRARALEREKSYQIQQALISVGSGGLTGKGWRQGTQTRGGFLPRGASHNDFIFSVIAEEKGFAGSVIVITLFSAVLFMGIRIAGEARDRLGKLLAVGVVTLYFSQVFINIGMNIRIMPVTGVPLPLLSYGGSSVISSLIAIGILQNVRAYRRSY